MDQFLETIKNLSQSVHQSCLFVSKLKSEPISFSKLHNLLFQANLDLRQAVQKLIRERLTKKLLQQEHSYLKSVKESNHRELEELLSQKNEIIELNSRLYEENKQDHSIYVDQMYEEVSQLLNIYNKQE